MDCSVIIKYRPARPDPTPCTSTFSFLSAHVHSGYNVLERPVENDSDALNVTVKFFIQQIFDLDEKEQYLQSAMWIELVCRLACSEQLFCSAQLNNEFRWKMCKENTPLIIIEVDRLHAALGARGVRRHPQAACALGAGLAARHPHVQQVRRTHTRSISARKQNAEPLPNAERVCSRCAARTTSSTACGR